MVDRVETEFGPFSSDNTNSSASQGPNLKKNCVKNRLNKKRRARLTTVKSSKFRRLGFGALNRAFLEAQRLKAAS